MSGSKTIELRPVEYERYLGARIEDDQRNIELRKMHLLLESLL